MWKTEPTRNSTGPAALMLICIGLGLTLLGWIPVRTLLLMLLLLVDITYRAKQGIIFGQIVMWKYD